MVLEGSEQHSGGRFDRRLVFDKAIKEGDMSKAKQINEMQNRRKFLSYLGTVPRKQRNTKLRIKVRADVESQCAQFVNAWRQEMQRIEFFKTVPALAGVAGRAVSTPVPMGAEGGMITMLKQIWKSTSESIVRIVVFACASCYAFGQAPTVIQIDMENYTAYYADNPDYSKLASSQQPVAPVSTNTFATLSGLGDIVRVNGEPVKGTWSIRGTIANYTPTPQPGQAIADTTRCCLVDWVFEIQKADGTPIGTIMATGVGHGPPPPGSPLALSPTVASSIAITGGTGAFLGIRGQAGFKEIAIPTRTASVAEDPSMRRTFGGGGKRTFLLTLIPLASPTILTNREGPLVFHSADFSPVCSAKPAFPGEILIVFASALGPTNPGVDPGQPFPSSPSAIANSPIEATVNGSSAQVLYAAGYPGTTNLYQVNVQLPATVQPGMAALQLTAAWQQGNSVEIHIGGPRR